jgi:hypothetical protein
LLLLLFELLLTSSSRFQDEHDPGVFSYVHTHLPDFVPVVVIAVAVELLLTSRPQDEHDLVLPALPPLKDLFAPQLGCLSLLLLR